MSHHTSQYARALAAAIGSDAKQLSAAKAELGALAEAVDSPLVRSFFGTPRVMTTEKVALVEKALGKKLSTEVLNLLKTCVENGRTGDLVGIAAAFATAADKAAGIQTARVVSASKLGKKDIDDLQKKLDKQTGKDIVIETAEDESLGAGMKIYLGDSVIDLSLTGKIHKLATQLA